MSMTTEVRRQRRRSSNAEVNFMGGTSYKLSPLETLKLVSASSIFGEPSYYRDGMQGSSYASREVPFEICELLNDIVISDISRFAGKNTAQIMETVIDEALDADFGQTLEWAIILRTEYLMRLNPQIVMVRAAMHPKRAEFTAAHPGVFNRVNKQVMSRADDVISQLTYFLFISGDKKNIPGVLKKSWANKINSLTRYELYKYRNHGIGLIDTIRICHAHGKDIDELMRTGTIEMPPENTTWETLRATGKSWTEITSTITMNHMALLRNLRGIFSEITDTETRTQLLQHLENGVLKGKQFPFRYKSAYDAVKRSDIQNAVTVLDSLETCMDISAANLPTLAGNNAFLSDNSGSAWSGFTSEYGSTKVAEINNLSCVLGAVNSEVGTVFAFGDKLIPYEISKRQGILAQTQQINEHKGRDVGLSTENGVWLFFDQAITEKIKYDNIFIYSDMQAGHGGLYGTSACAERYIKLGYATTQSHNDLHIDVAKLIADYRKQVNPKVNVFCVQTAGYTNALVESGYRTSVISGWTGKELVYAKTVNDFWDTYDNR